MFTEHCATFAGLPVVAFQRGSALPDLHAHAIALRTDWDSAETAVDLLGELLYDTASERLRAIVFGAWETEMFETGPDGVVEALISAAPQLPHLMGIFIGDVMSEECEVSWIHQTNLSPLFAAFPNLQVLQIRGSQGLSLGAPAHGSLQRLVIECGGLPAEVLRQLAKAKLPSLTHLELYLGDSGYGWDGVIADVEPLLTGELFPKLAHLGLRDSEIADEVAAAVARSPLMERLETLDLSLGTLSDTGAAALLGCPHLTRLKKLDLHHHYLSQEMMARFRQLPLEVDVSEQQEPSDWGDGEQHRYVAVGE